MACASSAAECPVFSNCADSSFACTAANACCCTVSSTLPLDSARVSAHPLTASSASRAAWRCFWKMEISPPIAAPSPITANPIGPPTRASSPDVVERNRPIAPVAIPAFVATARMFAPSMDMPGFAARNCADVAATSARNVDMPTFAVANAPVTRVAAALPISVFNRANATRAAAIDAVTVFTGPGSAPHALAAASAPEESVSTTGVTAVFTPSIAAVTADNPAGNALNSGPCTVAPKRPTAAPTFASEPFTVSPADCAAPPTRLRNASSNIWKLICPSVAIFEASCAVTPIWSATSCSTGRPRDCSCMRSSPLSAPRDSTELKITPMSEMLSPVIAAVSATVVSTCSNSRPGFTPAATAADAVFAASPKPNAVPFTAVFASCIIADTSATLLPRPVRVACAPSMAVRRDQPFVSAVVATVAAVMCGSSPFTAPPTAPSWPTTPPPETFFNASASSRAFDAEPPSAGSNPPGTLSASAALSALFSSADSFSTWRVSTPGVTLREDSFDADCSTFPSWESSFVMWRTSTSGVSFFFPALSNCFSKSVTRRFASDSPFCRSDVSTPISSPSLPRSSVAMWRSVTRRCRRSEHPIQVGVVLQEPLHPHREPPPITLTHHFGAHVDTEMVVQVSL